MLPVIIQAKSLKVTRALKEFTERQARKLHKIKDLRVNKVLVYLEQATKKDSDQKKVAVKYKIEVPGKDLWIKTMGYDFYDAIVDATNSAVRKMRKTKEKYLDKERGKKS